ncbi:MAG TPA: Wzz/FepE/Etk N-terminal domain-containing protein [Chitinophagaceae bacterium]|nr:Wzz/FepE/Etk N-terminal domain-containing protein [Chitinophagaceae bacterium]
MRGGLLVGKTLLDHWLILYGKKWVILMITSSAMITSLIFSLVLSPVYEAKAVFFVPFKQDPITFLAAPGQSITKTPQVPATTDELQGPYIGILKSTAIAEAVQKKFPHKTVHALLRRDMDFKVTDEYLIEVYARDHNPERAAGIANAYVEQFNHLMEGYAENSKLVTARATLKTQIEKTENDLQDARTALEHYQRENKSVSIEEETSQLVAQKMTVKNKRDLTAVSLKENDIKIDALKGQLAKEARLMSSEDVVVSSPLLTSIERQMTDLEVKMAALKSELTESHPEYIVLKNQAAKLKQEMKKEVKRIVKSQIKETNTLYENIRQQIVGLYVERETLAASMNASTILLKNIDEDITRLPTVRAHIDRLTYNIERNMRNLDILNNNMEELTAQEGKEMQAGIVVDMAATPKDPVFPVLWLNMLIALFAGTIAGSLYAFCLSYIEETKEARTSRIVKALLSEE